MDLSLRNALSCAVGLLLVFSSCTCQDSYYFQPHPQDQDVRKGQSVTLECGVSNSKHVVFYWTLNGDPLANTTRRYQVGSNLHITRVDPSKDLGEFKCIATNVTTGISLASQGAQLNILCLLVLEKTSSANLVKNTKSAINKVMIPAVPDRGGRPKEQRPPVEMPNWKKRSQDGGRGGGHQGGSGWQGRNKKFHGNQNRGGGGGDRRDKRGGNFDAAGSY